MTFLDLFTFANQHPVWTSIAALFGLILLLQATGQIRVYVSYFLVLASAFLWAFHAGNLLYFPAFCLGMLGAFAEIITKFHDEPVKSLGVSEALIYHVANGLIAAFGLRVLILFGLPQHTELDKLKLVFAAGFGSLALMRSKVVSVKVGTEDISVGPEQIIKVFLQYMEESIGRVRAIRRIDLVTKEMDNLNFEMVCAHTQALLNSAQMLSAEKKKQLEEKMAGIQQNKPEDPQLKSYLLGFLLLDEMGEEFVKRVYKDQRSEWLLGVSDKRPNEPLAEGCLPFRERARNLQRHIVRIIRHDAFFFGPSPRAKVLVDGRLGGSVGSECSRSRQDYVLRSMYITPGANEAGDEIGASTLASFAKRRLRRLRMGSLL